MLRFWITDPREGLTNIRGQVLLALWDSFKEHGIDIPFPHREIILKTPVAIERDDRPGGLIARRLRRLLGGLSRGVQGQCRPARASISAYNGAIPA